MTIEAPRRRPIEEPKGMSELETFCRSEVKP
jgi:hypothetical protein